MTFPDKSLMKDRFAPGLPCTDSHAHLEHACERVGEEEISRLLRSYELLGSGPTGREMLPFILDIGTKAGDLARRKERFGTRPCLHFSAGLWPGKAALDDIGAAMSALAKDAADPSCAAVGECGLDYFHMDAEPERQIELFEAQAALARERRLPLIVHSREAFEDTLKVVKEFAGSLEIVIHCFGYGAREAQAFLDLGCSISFAGNISYKKSEGLREALGIVPLDRLLLETDSPYMNPMPLRGRPSTPADIGRTISLASGLLGKDAEELALLVHRNAFRIFGETSPA